MKFTNFYFTEKLSIWRQFLNLFSKEKEIDIDLKKDIADKGYFSETDKHTFDYIISRLSDKYKNYLELKRSKKALSKSQTKDKIFARMAKKKELDILAGQILINVFKANIKGDYTELIPPEEKIVAALAYETSRSLIYHGYIVLVITENTTDIETLDDIKETVSINKYYVGADKLGLRFFKDLFGINMDMYLMINKHGFERIVKPIRKSKNKSKTREKTEIKKKTSDGIVKIGGDFNYKKDLFDDITNTWKNDKINFKFVKPDIITISGKNFKGYRYTLNKTEYQIGVYIGGLTELIIIFYGGENTVKEVKRLGLFNQFVENPNEIFDNVKYKMQ